MVQNKRKSMCFLGLDNAGKSTIKEFITKGDLVKTSPTLGFNLCWFKIWDLEINLIDLGGQWQFRHLWQKFYLKADLLVWVIDGSDLTRYSETIKELKTVTNQTNVPLLILVNKEDLWIDDQVINIRNQLRHEKFNPDRQCLIHRSSGKTGKGLIEAFFWAYITLMEMNSQFGEKNINTINPQLFSVT